MTVTRGSATTSRTGILAGGNWIIDQVKMIDVWPQPEALANISAQSQGTGGAPYNVLLDLAKMGAEFPLAGAGFVGRDVLGDAILADCRAHGIDTRWLKRNPAAPTSYTDVMTESKGGRRTFFHCRGANALWDGRELNFAKTRARIFHLGYLLLLDALDGPNATYGTGAAALLAAAQQVGLKTSVDAVSEDSDRFPRIVTPALKFTDYCIVNEFEAGRTTGSRVRGTDGRLDREGLRTAARALLKLGVREIVVIHFPEGGYAHTADGQETWQASLALPECYIAGSAGAGDAFCAGVLYGLHEGWKTQKCLLTGACAAAASLAHPTCTAGMKPLKTCMALARKYGFRSAQAHALPANDAQ